MKALMILKDIKINNDGLGLELHPNCVNDDVEQAIAELEALENRSCWNCKYSEKTTGGVYCMCFSMHPDFEYCSDWKLKK